MISENNICLLSDQYKCSHHNLYPPNATTIWSYFESRCKDNRDILFFGLQYLLKKYLCGQVVTKEKIEEAEDFWNSLFGSNQVFNKPGWLSILKNNNGYLPLTIRAIPEGCITPSNNVLFTVANTDRTNPWVVNWVETLLTQIWSPTTVATNSRNMLKIINEYLVETGTPELLRYKLICFGMRGTSSMETAGLAGMAHLVNSSVSDTSIASIYAKNYYHYNVEAMGVPATEHSTITSWTREHELEAVENMLNRYPDGLIACVGDSYDIYNYLGNICGDKLKERILSRNGTFFARLDSGYPPTMVCEALEIFGQKFGFYTNNKGYKVLNDKVRILQGDGIDISMLQSILLEMRYKRWSADNVTFGSGGGLLQKFNRDDLKFAFKASAIEIDGKIREVYKEPITDPGKTSKRGLLALTYDKEKGYVTQEKISSSDYPAKDDCLREIFRDGRLLVDDSLDVIRERASI